MTLIEYGNRVHFADNILEEAIWAELDRRGRGGVCLITDQQHATSDLGERVRAAVPRRMPSTCLFARGGAPREAEARAIAARCAEFGCDALLAYGPGEIINLAKAVRLMLGEDVPLLRFAESEGGTTRIPGRMPELIALPTLRGFGAAFNGLLSILLDDGRMIDIASRELTPTVTIADTSVTAKASPATRASTAVMAITLCAEALLSPHYNPPASGFAFDGLRRVLRALPPVMARDDADARRELMASCMNAAMIGEKGLGTVHAIASALCTVAPPRSDSHTLDKAATRRLLLPRIAAVHAEAAPQGCEGLAEALGVEGAGQLAGRLGEIFADLPLPQSLAALGLEAAQLELAAERAIRHRAFGNGPSRLDAASVAEILRAVF